jgi:hypothetical protein
MYANNKKGYYYLKELGLDRPKLRGTFTRNRLKLFYKRDRFFYSLDDNISLSDEPSNLILDNLELAN